MTTLTVQIDNCESNQSWTSDPNIIEVYLSRSFLELAKKCAAMMKENELSYVVNWYSLGYEFYEDTGNILAAGEQLNEGEQVGKNGYIHKPFEPEYRVEGCHAKIFADGNIKAFFPFKNTGEELWCTVGNVDTLLTQLNQIQPEPAAEEQKAPRYFIGQLEERNGEYLYTHTRRFLADDPVKYLDTIASRFYENDSGDQQGDGYYFHAGSVFVKPGTFQEITKEMFVALSGIITGL